MSRKHNKAGRRLSTARVTVTEPPVGPVEPSQAAPSSSDPEDRVALLASIANLILGLIAVLVYLLTKQAYAARIDDPVIEFIRQNIISIALPLAFAKPLLTSAFGGLPDRSWSIAKQRTFQLIRTVLSIALLMAVTIVPLYVAGVHETIYVFLRDRLVALSTSSGIAFDKLAELRVTFDRIVAVATSGVLGLVVSSVISFLVSYFANVVYARRQERSTRLK